jgi:hypothetical protein
MTLLVFVILRTFFLCTLLLRVNIKPWYSMLDSQASPATHVIVPRYCFFFLCFSFSFFSPLFPFPFSLFPFPFSFFPFPFSLFLFFYLKSNKMRTTLAHQIRDGRLLIRKMMTLYLLFLFPFSFFLFPFSFFLFPVCGSTRRQKVRKITKTNSVIGELFLIYCFNIPARDFFDLRYRMKVVVKRMVKNNIKKLTQKKRFINLCTCENPCNDSVSFCDFKG